MRSSRTVAVMALVLMLMSALPAVCLPLASITTPPLDCHQHHGTLPTHNCCRRTPSSPAALLATFHETTLEIVAPVVVQSPVPIGNGESLLILELTDFSSPLPSVLRI